MTKLVTSAQNPTVKTLASLRLRKYRAETGLFLAEGARTALEALDAGTVPRILAFAHGADAAAVERLSAACIADGGQCLEVTEPLLAKITRKDNPQPVVAAYATRLAPLSALRPEPGGTVVALDRVRDPGNLGTVIRTADAVAARALVLVGDCCDPYAPESVRASMGSVFNVSLHAGDEAAFLAFAATWPGAVVGTSPGAATSYRGVDYGDAVLAVLGTEQSGLAESLVRACTLMVRIPMFGKAESLNLAVAAGVLLYGIREGQERT
ncbi:MAG: RNA methyltransferase [Alphaproteobacteria bacterium]|nr:RNA methyltransferase [Alphaproteobacteria bacterium]